VKVYKDLLAWMDGKLYSDTTFDGLGRAVQSRTLESATGPVYVVKTTEYDALGRVWRSSNPVRGTPGVGDKTTFAYDALGRVLTATYPEGSVESHAYDGASETVRDPADKARNVTHDGLGRIASVVENPDGSQGVSPLTTSYTYDLLDNLQTVQQSGVRDRTFDYNEVGWLRSADNPELRSADHPELPRLVTYQYL
jgi:YD repeat-containing protein